MLSSMLEPGFYWVSVTEPLCDGGGVLAEPWGEPEVGRFDGLCWFLTGQEHALPDQIDVRVLGTRLEAAFDRPCDGCSAVGSHQSWCTEQLRVASAKVIQNARALLKRPSV